MADARAGVAGTDTSSEQTEAPASGSLWRHRDFLLLWGGQTVSEGGSAITLLALPLLAVTVLRATAFEVTVLEVVSSLAFLLLALPAGVVVDRLRKRPMLMWCDLGRTLLLGSIPVAAVLWHPTLWQLYLVAGLAGVLTVFFDIAYQSYLPVLVTGEQLLDGNGKLGTSAELSRLVGPFVGGALVGVLGAARAVAVDAGSFAVSALSLFLIRTPEQRPEQAAARGEEGAPPERVGFRAAMTEGLSFVLRHPILRKVVACTGTSNFFGSAGSALYVVFLARTLHASATVIGLVFSLGAVGGIVGGLTAGRLAERFGSARIIWLSMLVPAPFYFLVPLAQPGWGVLLFAAGYAAIGAMTLVYNTAQLSYRQRVCPPELLGRMNASVRWIVWGTIPLGSLLGGALATWTDVRTTMWISTVGSCLAVLWLLFSPLRTMRDVPET